MRPAEDIAHCVAFFTRLPVPVRPLSDRPFAGVLWAAPVAGWLVGAIGAAAYVLGHAAGLPAGPAAVLALAATLAVTGCRHEDGLSDTADGFGGGRDAKRRLEIMRDSRIGSYGACALGLSLLTRWSALAAIAEPGAVFWAMLAAHGASRAVLPGFMLWTPPARADGLSAGVGTPEPMFALGALALGVVSLLLLGAAPALVAVLCLGVVAMFFRNLCLTKIGGQTGDTAGALQQLCEIAVLLCAASTFS
jgi:adenosylcobinamide-GDP ribazoletransferase